MDHQTQAIQKEIPDDVSEAGSDMSCSSATSGVSVYSYSSKVRQTRPLCVKLKTDLKRENLYCHSLYIHCMSYHELPYV